MKKKFPEMTEYTFSESELAEIKKTAKEKFSSWEWNFGNSPKCTLTRNTRFTGGKIQVFVTLNNSVIENIKFYGTFFGNNSDLAPIEETLIGVKYTPEAIQRVLEEINISDYFAGFSVEELVEAIVE